MKIDKITPVRTRSGYDNVQNEMVIRVYISLRGDRKKASMHAMYVGVFLRSIGQKWEYLAAGWKDNRLVIWKGDKNDFRISANASRSETSFSLSNKTLCLDVFRRYGIAIPTAPDSIKRATFEVHPVEGEEGYYELFLLSVK